MSTEVTASAFVIGEALIDEVTQADGSRAEHPGGSPANVALTLGRLGRSAQLLTWFGNDPRGQVITDWLTQSRVDVVAGSNQAPKTSLASATLAADGSASYQFDLDPQVPAGVSVPHNAVVAHTGSIAAVLQPGAAVVKDLLVQAQATATITYDPNARPSLMGSVDQARTTIEQYVGLADVVKVSDEDLEWLYPGQAPLEVAAQWLTRGPAVVVVTLGGSGAAGLCAAGRVSVQAPRVTVVDTVGAGDSFMGALIDGLWEAGLVGAGNRTRLKDISTASLTAVLERCTRVAAITVSRAGANPPWSSEL